MTESNNESSKQKKKSCCGSFCDWIGTPSFYIYTNFFLGAWGDRMWKFSVGMYLVVLSEGLLRLAAIFGLCSGCSVLLFGGIIGNWVDRTRRLTAIRISLFIQNFTTMLSAIAVFVTIYYEEEIDAEWNGGLKTICEGLIVSLAILAQLASVAYKISIEKDWVVVVAGKNLEKLTNLNAVVRAIDLSCKVLAPTSAGFIMYYASLEVSALVIAGWNLVSVFIEYALLRKVYSLVPELALEKTSSNLKQINSKKAEKQDEAESEKLTPNGNHEDSNQADKEEEEIPLNDSNPKKAPQRLPSTASQKEKKTTVEMMFNPCIILFKSWGVYIKQSVVFAGLSLSFLYMTVLGFDSITVGFIYANGVSELAVGIAMACAGVTGIIGTFIFTRLRPRIGLERTGLFAYFIEVTLLSLCVLSIFAPGSPFQHNYRPGQKNDTCIPITPTEAVPIIVDFSHLNESDDLNHSIGKRDLRNADVYSYSFQEQPWIWSTESGWNIDVIEGIAEMRIESADTESIPSVHFLDLNYLQTMDNSDYDSINAAAVINRYQSLPSIAKVYSSQNQFGHKPINHDIVKRQADGINDTITGRSNATGCEEKEKVFKMTDYISVSLLLIGIVASRVGLWMADLTVTQLLQENVPENERGAVGGVQNSLNMTFDLLKFVVVIFVPYIETFGYLIIMSFSFIVMAGCLFAYHTYRVRGYVLHKNRKKAMENGTVKVVTGEDDAVIENSKDPVPV